MPVLRRATEQQQSEWRPVDEGLWRWIVGKPEVAMNPNFGKYEVKFPLVLSQSEQARLTKEHGAPPEGVQQSWRTTYKTGLSLGYLKDGQYQSTKLIDFLAACLGSQQTKKFRDWISKGGGPPRPTDLLDDKAEIEAIEEWLGWWDNLEVYGTIRHQDSKDGSRTFANFAGPLPVGSLPGQPDDDYQAHGRGKLRAIIAESGETREELHREERVAAMSPAAAQTVTRFTKDGDAVQVPIDPDELPF